MPAPAVAIVPALCGYGLFCGTCTLQFALFTLPALRGSCTLLCSLCTLRFLYFTIRTFTVFTVLASTSRFVHFAARTFYVSCTLHCSSDLFRLMHITLQFVPFKSRALLGYGSFCKVLIISSYFLLSVASVLVFGTVATPHNKCYLIIK